MIILILLAAVFASETERRLHAQLFDEAVYNPKVIQDSWRKANRASMTIRVLEHLQKISVQVGAKLKSVLFECWQLAGHYSINFRLRILKKATIRQKSLTLR